MGFRFTVIIKSLAHHFTSIKCLLFLEIVFCFLFFSNFIKILKVYYFFDNFIILLILHFPRFTSCIIMLFEYKSFWAIHLKQISRQY